MLDEIRELCRTNKISIDKLEQSIGIGKNAIYKWDKASPSVDRVIAVADYFGVSVDRVIGRDNGSVRTELSWCLQGMNDEGVEMVTNYANFILSQPQYKKYNITNMVAK